MELDRRTFLAGAAAAPLFFGLGEAAAQEDASLPSWLAAARKRMKETRRYGVLLSVPSDRDAQRRLGDALGRLLDDEQYVVEELFCEAVFIFAPPALARRLAGGSAGRSNRFLLAPDGELLQADDCPPKTFDLPAQFASSFRVFLRGTDNALLRLRAEEIEKNLPEELRSALVRLDADDFEERDAAGHALFRHADQVMPYLTYQSLVARSPEVRGRLHDVVRRHFREARSDTFGPRLPYGTRLPRLISVGCGARVPEEDVPPRERNVAVACGIVMVAPEERRFIRFLAR